MGPVEGVGVGVEASVATIAEAYEVRGMAMVEVVGSSPACSWDYLGLPYCGEVGAAVAGPCGDDGRQQMVCSVRWSFRVPTLHCSPSELSIRVGAVLPLMQVAEFGIGLFVFHMASMVRVRLMFIFSEVGVACSEIREGNDAEK